MAKFVKALIALSIVVIFFSGVYLASNNSSGQNNLVAIGSKLFAAAASNAPFLNGGNPAVKMDLTQPAGPTPAMGAPDTQDPSFNAQQQIAEKDPSMGQDLQNVSLRPNDVKALAAMMQNAHGEEAFNNMMQQNQAAMDAMTKDMAASMEKFAKENPQMAQQFAQQQAAAQQAAAQAQPQNTATEIPQQAATNLALSNKSLQDMSPEELTSALMLAVSSNELTKAKHILSYGADPNTVENATSATPLFTAIAANNPQMVQLLLDHGADVNQVNEKGYMPLHEVASGAGFASDKKFRSNEMIDSLIQHGADINQKNSKGQTAIMIACKTGRKETLLYLLNKNASTNQTDLKGKTVGDYASEVPAKECFDVLRKYTKDQI